MSNTTYEHHFYDEPKIPFFCKRYRMKQTRISDLHWHEHLELLYGIDGSGQVGANRYPLNEGDTVIVNTGEPHNICSNSEVVYECLIINADFCRENGLDIESVFFKPHIRDREAGKLIADVSHAFKSNEPLRILNTRTAVLKLLLYLCEHHTTDRHPYANTPSLESIKKAVRFIRAHYAEPLTLDDAAAAAGLSRYYFTREFRHVTGQSFVPYLNAVRCHQATVLLRRGMSVTEACYACGFRELAYFSRTFRKLMGQSPSAFREPKQQ